MQAAVDLTATDSDGEQSPSTKRRRLAGSDPEIVSLLDSSDEEEEEGPPAGASNPFAPPFGALIRPGKHSPTDLTGGKLAADCVAAAAHAAPTRQPDAVASWLKLDGATTTRQTTPATHAHDSSNRLGAR